MSKLPSADSFDAIYALPTCRFGARSDGEHINLLAFLPPAAHLQAPTTPLLKAFGKALHDWLASPDAPLPVTHRAKGTAFQQRVWRAISAIPRGQTRCYGELVASAGGTARAIGQACGANPLPILVPCHRVVAASGLGGFANASDGWLIETKKWLLAHEGAL
ncbi:methylated-DNA--[protein]-cysteine S-methyltransferase [Viridibacterium curvum]|uniref:Methylated-DNA--[protein]-cysteine S-methyltransferase n=1 Tax=Viridibacterium curvum TaxID=1101404 RepID=A0ABP9R3V1_9RHOO